jgi:hypothetical protein
LWGMRWAQAWVARRVESACSHELRFPLMIHFLVFDFFCL